MKLVKITHVRCNEYDGTATDDENQRVHDELDWSHAEDAMNDQLPDGYYCKIED